MTHDLAALRKLDMVTGASLRTRLTIAVDADTLTHNSAKLEAAISTLTGYIRNLSAAEIDPAFLATEVQYLAGANARATAAVRILRPRLHARRRPRRACGVAFQPNNL